MTTELITLDLDQPTDPSQLTLVITAALAQFGTPLRWAITALPRPGQIRVEAVVTVGQWQAENLETSGPMSCFEVGD